MYSNVLQILLSGIISRVKEMSIVGVLLAFRYSRYLEVRVGISESPTSLHDYTTRKERFAHEKASIAPACFLSYSIRH